LTGAFFSIPIAEESQQFFAFTWQRKQLRWTRLPQGFTSTPTIFSQILKNSLQDLIFPNKSVLRQYVDDLLLASKTKDGCIGDTIHLCIQLVKKGHRASPSKLQFCEQQVKYLGFILKPGITESQDHPVRVKAIQETPRQITKKQLRGYLGQVRFCCPWIPGFSEIARPSHEATQNEESELIAWGAEREKTTLKVALLSAPALGLPDYSKPFKVYCDET
ncbi:hypothetical protein N321_10612, partial [Antrostomus carolinensis]